MRVDMMMEGRTELSMAVAGLDVIADKALKVWIRIVIKILTMLEQVC